MLIPFFFRSSFFETGILGTSFVDQVDLKVTEIHMPLPSQNSVIKGRCDHCLAKKVALVSFFFF